MSQQLSFLWIFFKKKEEKKVWNGFWIELCNKKKEKWDRKLLEDFFDAYVGLNEIWGIFFYFDSIFGFDFNDFFEKRIF